METKPLQRLISLLLCFALLAGYFPMPAHAAANHGLCEHHEVHADCGYVEGESECGYVCDICAQEAPETTMPETTEPVEETTESVTATTEIVEETTIPMETEEFTAPELMAAADATSGTCGDKGDNVTWSLEGGVMTFAGTGKMDNYCSVNKIYGAIVSIDYVSKPWSTAGITSVVIGNGITNVGGGILRNASSLTSVSIPGTVTSIWDGAFEGCTALPQITIPGSVTYIYEYAFKDCTNLRSITFEGSAPSFIDAYVFSGVTATCYYPITDASWTADVMQQYGGTITWEGYDPCEGGHTYVDFICSVCGSSVHTGTCGDNAAWSFDAATGVLTISGTGATDNFSEDDAPFTAFAAKVKSVVVENGITELGDELFSGLSNATSVRLPDTLTRIGEAAMYGMGFTELVLPNSVTRLEEDALSSNWDCTSLTLSENLTYIDDYALYRLTGLTELTIPASVTYMGEFAIRSCDPNLVITFLGDAPANGTGAELDTCTAYYPSTNPTWTEEARTNLGGGTTWIGYDPCADGHDYVDGVCTVCGGRVTFGTCGTNLTWNFDSATGTLTISGSGEMMNIGSMDLQPWAAYQTAVKTVVIEPGVTSIASSAFENFVSVTDITIPASVTEIGVAAFRDCICLTEITIPEGITKLRGFVFYGCSSLSSVNIPVGVTSIDIYLFYGCSSLTNVTLPVGITAVGQYVFSGCSSLTSVNIPEGVIRIGERAFGDCSNLNTVSIPASVTSIGKSAFSGCSSLTSVAIPAGISAISQYTFFGCSSLTNVNIPTGVTNIGEAAFSGCSSLTSVNIPAGVTNIGDGAFHDCSSLTSVDIPAGVTNIDQRVFYGCSSLTSVDIPAGVTSIGHTAFYNCSSLTSITIPESVAGIGESAFYLCDALTDVYYNGTMDQWDSIEIGEYNENLLNATIHFTLCDAGHSWMDANCVDPRTCAVCWETEGEADPDGHEYENGVCNYCGEVLWPLTGTCGENITWTLTEDGVLTISGTGAMPSGSATWKNYSEYITSVVIEEGITSIAGYAFQYCDQMTEISLPEGLTSIGDYAFADCKALQYIELPNTVTSLGERVFIDCWYMEYATLGSVTSIPFDAFHRCYRLKSVEIPDSVTSIGGHCFGLCYDLEEIVIPDSVTSIGNYAISECNNLQRIVVGKNVNFLGDRALAFNKNVKNIYFRGNAPTFEFGYTFYNVNAKVYYPQNDTTWNGSNKVDHGGTLTWIAYNPCELGHRFENDVCTICGQNFILASGTCGPNLTWTVNCDYVLTISGTGYMDDYTSYTNVNAAPWWEYADQIVAVVMEDGITSLGNHAFEKLTGVTEITIPETVTSIGYNVFDGCPITELVIPDSVRSIAGSALSGMSKLERLTIPFVGNARTTATETFQFPFGYIFGYNSFADSYSIQQSYYGGTLVSTNTATYSLPRNLKFVRVTGGEILHGAFSNCAKIETIVLPQNITAIGDQAFYLCNGLKSVNVPDGVTTIGDHAFYGTGLTNVVLPQGLTSIGKFAYTNCQCLTSLYIPGSVQEIGAEAFRTCVNLTQVTLGEGIPYIGERMFGACQKLISIQLPGSITAIYDDAFNGCICLSSMNIPENVAFIGDYAFNGCSEMANITFAGDAPQFGENAFYNLSTTVRYPADNGTWTEDVLQNYGGDITWEPYCTGEHDYQMEIMPPTCIDDGYTCYTCSVCGDYYETDYVPANGEHNYITNVGPSYCGVHASVITYTCELCGYSYEETGEYHPSHNYVDNVVKAPTCTEDGDMWCVCEYCGDSFQAPARATGHSYVNGICENCGDNNLAQYPELIPDTLTYVRVTSVDVANNNGEVYYRYTPVITEKFRIYSSTGGVDTYVHLYDADKNQLTTDDDSGESNNFQLDYVLEAGRTYLFGIRFYNRNTTGNIPTTLTVLHEYEAVITTAPTCTTEGEANYTCTYCGHSYVGTVEVAPHTYDNGVVTAPKCEEQGYTTYTCVDCGYSYQSEYIEPTGHSYVGTVTAPTCVETGYTTYVCDCGSSHVADDTPILGHNYQNGACQRCGAEEPYAHGICGTNLFWEIDDDDILVIYGSGAMYDYDVCGAPWYDYGYDIQGVAISRATTHIGSFAFCDLMNITSITIPNNVNTIGDSALTGCGKLTEVTLPFVGASKYATSSDHEPFGYIFGQEGYNNCIGVEHTDGTFYYVPKNLSTVTVTGGTLFGYAFYNCTKITTINLRDNVNNVQENVFSGCANLKTVNIASGLSSIGNYTFKDCINLETVTIGDSVTSIGYEAFYGCTSLKTVDLPSRLTSIGREAFYNCTSLETVKIPEGITDIPYRTFYNCSAMTTLELPSTLTSISWSAFANCASLQELNLPQSLTTMGEGVFSNCSSLTELTIPKNLKIIPESAFSGCTGLTTLVLPRGVTTISNNAFYNCSALTDVTMVSVAKIDYYAFGNCSSLVSIELPTFLNSLGSSAFSGCTSLETITIPENIVVVPDSLLYNCSSLREVTLSPDTTGVGSSAFSGCTALTTVELPETVTSLGSNAFHNTGLTEILLPDGLTTIGDGAFNSCANLTEIELPENVSYVGSFAFRYSGLTSIRIPDSVKTLGQYAFSECQSLQTVSIGSGVEELANNTFSYCDALENVTLNDGLNCIGGSAFYDCDVLAAVIIPEGVETIGTSAFQNCDMLQEISLPNTLVSIGGYAFYDCDALESIVIPDSVTTMGGYAFQKCNVLTSVTLSDSLNAVGEYTFRECSALQDVDFGSGITAIGQYAFAYCYHLADIVLPDSLTTIDQYAFYGCSNRKNITFGNGLTNIGTRAFDNNDIWYMEFTGDAPAIAENSFQSNSFVAFYPAGNDTWTEETMQNYGANNARWYAKGDLKAPALTVTPDENENYRSVLSWNEVPGAVSYDVFAYHTASYYEEDSYRHPYQLEKVASVTDTTYTDMDMVLGYEAVYAVAAVDENGAMSFFSNVEKNTAHLETPVLLSAEHNGYNAIRFTWTPVDDAEYYRLYRSATPEAPGEYVTDMWGTDSGTVNVSSKETWYYRIAAMYTDESAAHSFMSNAICVMNPLSATNMPSVNHYWLEDNSQQLTVYWNQISGAVAYELYRAVGENGEFSLITTTTDREYVDTDLQPGKGYYYKVRALAENEIYHSGYSAVNSNVCYLTLPDDSAEPTVTHAPATGIPSVNWEAVEGAVRYDVYVHYEEDWNWVYYDTTSETTYAFTELPLSQRMYCQIRAIAEDERANVAFSYKNFYRQPAQPMGLSAVILEDGSVQITWEAVEGISYYYVHQGTSPDAPSWRIQETGDLFCTDRSFTPGMKNYYWVQGYSNGGSTGALSEPVSIDVPLAKLNLHSVENYETEFYMNWSDVSGAVAYEVYRAVGENGEFSLVATVDSTEYYDSDIQPGKGYYYKVRALGENEIYHSPFSNVQSAACYLSAEGIDVSVTHNTEGYPVINWNDVEGAVRYDLYIRDEDWNLILAEQDVKPGHVYTNLNVGTNVYFQLLVAAEDARANVYTAQMEMYRVAAQPVVAAEYDAQQQYPVLSWDVVEGADAYYIYRYSKYSGEYTNVNTAYGTSYVDTSAYRGQRNYYKVCASGGVLSEAVYVDVPLHMPNMPSVYRETSDDGRTLIVDWNDVTDAVAYEVYRAVGVDGEYELLATTEKSIHADSDLYPGKSHAYKIRAIAEDETYHSAFSPSNSAVCNLLQGELNVFSSHNIITGIPGISWPEVEGAVRYDLYLRNENWEYELWAEDVKPGHRFDNLELNRWYYIQIRVIAEDERANGTSGEFTVYRIPGQPKITAAFEENWNAPVIHWNTVEGADYYNVYRVNPETGENQHLAQVNDTYYVDTDASFGSWNSYMIRAWGNMFESADSNVVSVAVKLSRPYLSRVDYVAGDCIYVCWDSVPGAVAYEVYRAFSEDGEYTLLETVSDREFCDYEMNSGKAQYYKIKAIAKDESYNSEFSNVQYVACGLSIEGMEIRVTYNESGIPEVYWNEVAGAVRYDMYVRTDDAGEFYLAASNVTSGYAFDYLTVGADCAFYIRVVAEDEQASVNTGAYGISRRPGKVEVYATYDTEKDRVNLSWSTEEGVEDYEIYYSLRPDSEFEHITTCGIDGYEFYGMNRGTRNYFKICAYSNGFYGAFSDVVYVDVPLRTPGHVYVGSNGNEWDTDLYITWKTVDGADSYEIYRAEEKNGEYIALGRGYWDYTDYDIQPGKLYYYKVQAIAQNSELNSGLSAAASGYYHLSSPELSFTHNAKGEPVLSWTAVNGAVSYEVYSAYDGRLIHRTTDTSYTYWNIVDVETVYVRAIAEYSPANVDSNYCQVYREVLTEIVSQPENRDILVGEEAVFSVYATGVELTYQWQYCRHANDTWKLTTVVGNKTDTLVVAGTFARDGYQYRCVVTDIEGNEMYSDAATLRVTGIRYNPDDLSVLDGEEVFFGITATGAIVNYQWQYRSSEYGAWKNLENSESLNLWAAAARDGYQYRCVITDRMSNVLYSEPATLRVTGITKHPVSYNGAIGGSNVFRVTATGEGLKYLWQYRASETGTWRTTTLTGYRTDALTIPVTASRNGFQYRCKITDAAGNVIYSDAATLAIAGITILEHPDSQTVALNETVDFFVDACGTGLKYQWQYRTSATGTWYATTVTGNKTDTITVTATSGRNGYQYRCVITDANGNQAITDVATLTVQQTGLSIQTQPVSVSAKLNDSVSFTVKASGEGLKYQWQWRKNASGTWAATTATGNKTATMTVTATSARNGYQYRCVITDANGKQVISEAAILTVAQNALTIQSQPVSVNAALNDSVSFTVKATGEGLKYQWQWRKNASGTWAATTATGNKTATMTVTATEARNGYQYRCVITDANGKQVISNTAILTVGQSAIVIKSQPKSVNAALNTSVSFTVEAIGDGLSYQWQYRSGATGTWKTTTLTGAKTATLKVTATTARNGYQYRCVITDAAGIVVNSDGATLTVK